MSSDQGPTVLKTKREEAAEHNARYCELRDEALSVMRAIENYKQGVKAQEEWCGYRPIGEVV